MDRLESNRRRQILPIHQEKPVGHLRSDHDQRSIRFLRLAPDRAQGQYRCGQYSANILERLMPYAKERDWLLPDRSAY